MCKVNNKVNKVPSQTGESDCGNDFHADGDDAEGLRQALRLRGGLRSLRTTLYGGG